MILEKVQVFKIRHMPETPLKVQNHVNQSDDGPHKMLSVEKKYRALPQLKRKQKLAQKHKILHQYKNHAKTRTASSRSELGCTRAHAWQALLEQGCQGGSHFFFSLLQVLFVSFFCECFLPFFILTFYVTFLLSYFHKFLLCKDKLDGSMISIMIIRPAQLAELSRREFNPDFFLIARMLCFL